MATINRTTMHQDAQIPDSLVEIVSRDFSLQPAVKLSFVVRSMKILTTTL
jgi:hypothetical protein